MSHDSSSPIGAFERYLSLWVALCIVAGVEFGATLPNALDELGFTDRVIAQDLAASVNLTATQKKDIVKALK